MRRLGLILCALGIAACDDTVVGQVNPVVLVAPLHLDFGTVELGQDKSLPIVLSNLEIVPAEFTVSVEDDCDGCFAIFDAPTQINRGDYDMPVRFRAVRLEIATATVTVQSKVQGTGPVFVTMVGRGSDMRRPDVEVAPPELDFGFVPAGGISVQSFVVRSTGTNDLRIDSVEIDPADAPFRITTSTPAAGDPFVMGPGTQASASVRAELPATSTGTVTARILIRTNVLEEKNVPGEKGVVAIPLRAKANLPPLAVAGPDQTVEPWSRATLDGSMSHDQDNPPDDPITYRWELISKPEGSTTYLEQARTPTPSFWVDLAGRYEARLVVTDALGLESQNRAVTVIEALPTNAVRIELIWDHPDSDLDLHFIREGGSFCDCGTDVHYRDCARAPNWFPATPGANPRLDIDDRSGFGPENINLDGDGPNRFIPPGNYQIVVHYYSSNDDISTWPTTVSNAIVRVYIYGLLAAELSKPLERDGDLWTAGILTWPSGQVSGGGQVTGGQICAIF